MEPFASPNNLDPRLRSFLQDSCSQLCDWFAETEKLSPLPDFTILPDIPPELEGLSTDRLLGDLQIIMDSSYRPSHPGSLSHLDPPPLTSSIVADLICAGLNNNLLAYELSPGLTKLEQKLCKWMAVRIGMRSESGGVLASGGTISNLMGLVMARKISGLENDPIAVVLASTDAHISILKSLRIMGLPNDSFREVSCNKQGQICLNDLNIQLKRLRNEGRKCFAVIATAGSTIRGAIDPLNKLSEFTRSEGLWLHVDGAIGGVFGLVDSTMPLVKGISLANSVSINPQKLLGVAKTSSVLLVENLEHLKNTFGTDMPYLEPVIGDDCHGGEIGLQGTRQADVLKLWLGLRQLGQKGIKSLLEEAITRREYLEKMLDSTKLEIISGPLHLIAITPRGYNIKKAESWSKNTREVLLAHKILVSRPFYNGRHHLKIVLGNPHTKSFHLEQLSEIVNQSVI